MKRPDPTEDLVLLANQTAHRVCIAWTGDEDREAIQIPPYGQREVHRSEAASMDLEPWLSRGIVTSRRVVEEPQILRPIGEGILEGLLGVGVWAGLAWLVWDAIGEPPRSYWLWALGAALLLATVLAAAQLRERGGEHAIRTVLGALLRPLSWGRALAGDMANVTAVALVAVGVPAAVILATGGWASPADAGTVAPLGLIGRWLEAQLGERALHLTGRGLQLVVIALLSSLPAALYFLFDRRKLQSLRQRFFRSVLVLDPDVRTLEDVASVYGDRVDEVLGGATKGGRRPPMGLTRQVMVPLTTLVLAVGWTVTLDPVGPVDANTSSLVSFFTPHPSAMVFAFLGGYLFAIGMLLRRYVRSDLKPETLTHALVRILGAILMAWAAEVAWPDMGMGALYLVSFVIGVFPESGMDWLTERARSIMASRASTTGTPDGATLSERFPLDCLDGINIYHRSRLMDEGVDNLENLAHSDLVDLVLDTRIPMGTLVDWVDQAILLLHTRSANAALGHDEVLRDHGVRTATDLEMAWHRAWVRGDGDAFLALLGSTAGTPPRLRIILDALEDDQWMAQLRQARAAGRGRLPLRAEHLPLWDEGEDRLAEEMERIHEKVIIRRMQAATATREKALAIAPPETGSAAAAGALGAPFPPAATPGKDHVGAGVVSVEPKRPG